MAFCLHCGQRRPDGATRWASCGSGVEPAETGEPQGEAAVFLDPALTDRIKKLAWQGQKIRAIKEYRGATGASLHTAKEAIEAWMDSGEPLSPSAASLDPGLTDNVQQLARQGQKIQAIKKYREATGASLKTSKDAIEAWMNSQGISRSPGTGCGASALLLLLLGGVLSAGLW